MIFCGCHSKSQIVIIKVNDNPQRYSIYIGSYLAYKFNILYYLLMNSTYQIYITLYIIIHMENLSSLWKKIESTCLSLYILFIKLFLQIIGPMPSFGIQWIFFELNQAECGPAVSFYNNTLPSRKSSYTQSRSLTFVLINVMKIKKIMIFIIFFIKMQLFILPIWTCSTENFKIKI